MQACTTNVWRGNTPSIMFLSASPEHTTEQSAPSASTELTPGRRTTRHVKVWQPSQNGTIACCAKVRDVRGHAVAKTHSLYKLLRVRQIWIRMAAPKIYKRFTILQCVWPDTEFLRKEA